MEWHCNGTATVARMDERMHHYRRILLWLVLVAPAAFGAELTGKVAQLNDEESEFLPVDQAFVMTAELARRRQPACALADAGRLLPVSASIRVRRTRRQRIRARRHRRFRRARRRSTSTSARCRSTTTKPTARVPGDAYRRGRRHARGDDRLSRLRRRGTVLPAADQTRVVSGQRSCVERRDVRAREHRERRNTRRRPKWKRPRNNIWRRCSTHGKFVAVVGNVLRGRAAVSRSRRAYCRWCRSCRASSSVRADR